MATWHPVQYLQFSSERLRPALDLFGRIPLTTASKIADVGCGTGIVIPYLRQRWQDAQIIGVDSSPDMLATAQQSLKDEQIHWQLADIAQWQSTDAPFDLLFSNAALHWLPNHAQLLPLLLTHLAVNGVFAMQVPNNFAFPTHTSLFELAKQDFWQRYLAVHLPPPTSVLTPQEYYNLLSPLCQSVEIWQTTYYHALTGEQPVFEWIKGSWLRPILDILPPELHQRFAADYSQLLAKAYPKDTQGKTLLPFTRLFCIAIK